MGRFFFCTRLPLPARCARHRTGALRAPPHRTGALRAPRASRFARIDGRRLTPCGAKRRAASAGGLRGAASNALRLSFSPLCGLFRAHRREVESVRLAVCSWRPAAAAAGVRPSFGRPRQTAAYPATWNRSSRAVVGRGIGRPRRARLLSAFPAAAASGKSLLLDPAPASGIPPAAPCRGPRCGRRRSPPAGQNPCSTRRKPGRARRRAPLRGIALACWFRVAPAGGGRSYAVLARAAAQTAAACCGAPPAAAADPAASRSGFAGRSVVRACGRAARKARRAGSGCGGRGGRKRPPGQGRSAPRS